MTEDDKDERIKQLEAQVEVLSTEVRAQAAWRRAVEDREFEHRRATAATGAPLSGALGPTARLAIDSATRGPDVDQLNLISRVGRK